MVCKVGETGPTDARVRRPVSPTLEFGDKKREETNKKKSGPYNKEIISNKINEKSRMRMNRRPVGNEQVLEEFNSTQSDQLAEKVRLIKGLSQQIKHDIEASDLLIRDVDRDMNSADSLINETLLRLKKVTESESSRHMIYLALFIVAVFVALWFFM